MELAGISPQRAKCRWAPALSRKPRGCRAYGKAAGGADGQNAHVRFLDGFVPASFLSGQQGHHAGKQDIPQADVPVGGQIMHFVVFRWMDKRIGGTPLPLPEDTKT